MPRWLLHTPTRHCSTPHDRRFESPTSHPSLLSPHPLSDAGTGFHEQVFQLSPREFLPKQWIMARWEEGFYITGEETVGLLLLMARQLIVSV